MNKNNLKKHIQNKTKQKGEKKRVRVRERKVTLPSHPHFPELFSRIVYLFLHQNLLRAMYLHLLIFFVKSKLCVNMLKLGEK